MSTCRRIRRDAAAFFDGELRGDVQRRQAVEEHLAACPQCAAYLQRLETVREATGAVASRHVIEDAQFPAFLNALRERIEAPAPRPRRLLAVASLVAAALITAVAALTIFSTGPAPVSATEVESISTDLEGATVDWYDSEDGTTTLQVNTAEDYVW